MISGQPGLKHCISETYHCPLPYAVVGLPAHQLLCSSVGMWLMQAIRSVTRIRPMNPCTVIGIYTLLTARHAVEMAQELDFIRRLQAWHAQLIASDVET